MKQIKSTIAFIIVLFFTACFSEAQTWQNCASLPEAMVPASVAVNGKIFAVRSSDFYRGSLSEASYMYEYDPAANPWTKKGKMNSIRTYFNLIECGGRIYAIGGVSNGDYNHAVTLTNVEEYDIASGTWINRCSLPQPLYQMGIEVTNNKIYCFGGITRKLVNDQCIDSTSNKLYEYDTVSDVWTVKSGMIKCRAWLGTALTNEKIYAVGGNDGNTQTGNNTIEEYDINNDTWTIKCTFTNGFDGQCQAVAYNGKIYTLSSDLQSNGTSTKGIIGEYDPALNTWIEKAQMITPVMDFAKIIVDDKLYIIGGHPLAAMNYSNKTFEYNFSANEQTFLPNISQWLNGTVKIDKTIYLIGGVNSNAVFTNKVVKYNTSFTSGTNEINIVPSDFKLMQNYPNPFNPSTTIQFSIPLVETQHGASLPINLKIFDALGREVATLVNESKPTGNYSVTFNAETLHGAPLPSGVYFYQFNAGNYIETKKMMLMK